MQADSCHSSAWGRGLPNGQRTWKLGSPREEDFSELTPWGGERTLHHTIRPSAVVKTPAGLRLLVGDAGHGHWPAGRGAQASTGEHVCTFTADYEISPARRKQN